MNGKAKYKYVYGKTQKELDEKVLEVKMSLKKGIDITADNDTFGYWAEHWLKLTELEVSTGRFVSYKSWIKKLSALYDYKIKKLTSADFQNIIIDYNPVCAIKIPKKQAKEGRRALTAEERQWIIDTPDFMQLPSMIMMFAGLRRGEVTALLWSDIDLKKRTITVNKSAEVIKGTFTVKDTTKTAAGMRTIYIPQILVDFLSQQERSTNLLVCPSPTGIMISTKTWNRKWQEYILKLNEKYGDFSTRIISSQYKKNELAIPYFTAHCLRHTFITMMYMAGIDVLTAKEQAGHKDIRTTMSIYTHLDSKYKEKNMSKLDEYLNSGCQTGVVNFK